MALPTPPVPPQLPVPAEVAPAPSPSPVPVVVIPPSTPITPSPMPSGSNVSTSSIDLAPVAASRQENNNSSNVQNRVYNVNSNVNDLTGGRLSVGDISVSTPSIYVNGNYGRWGDYSVGAGIVIPFGGGKARRAANQIAYNKGLQSRGELCMSVYRNRMTETMIYSAFGAKDATWLRGCIDTSTREIAVVDVERVPRPSIDADLEAARRENAQIRAELDAIRAELNARRAVPPEFTPPPAKPVQGLW
jgi:hypothetical protein